MKKFLSGLALALCVILGTVSLTACGNKIRWLRPEFAYAGEGITVKFVNNEQTDFEFPIAGEKLDHSNFASLRSFEYAWALYNGDDIVGWIKTGSNGYDFNKKNRYYGFSTTVANGKYGYSNTDFLVVLKSTDLTIFDRLEITSDYGSIEKMPEMDQNPTYATERYTYFDETSNQVLPQAGAENFVCCVYSLELESIDPKGPRTLNITLSLKNA